MDHFKRTTRTAVIAGIAAICGLVIAASYSDVSLASDRFSIGFGTGQADTACTVVGNTDMAVAISPGAITTGRIEFCFYGYGPYGYGNTSGYSGWNSNYNSYSPYTSNYYNPYSSWSYSPYGSGTYRPYGY